MENDSSSDGDYNGTAEHDLKFFVEANVNADLGNSFDNLSFSCIEKFLVTICVDPWRDDPVYNSDEESNEDEVLHSICCTVYAISLFYNTLREITNIFTFSSLLKTFLGG